MWLICSIIKDICVLDVKNAEAIEPSNPSKAFYASPNEEPVVPWGVRTKTRDECVCVHLPECQQMAE